MKILFCSDQILAKEFGASKVFIELAEELEIIGWKCKFIDPSDINANWAGFPGRNAYTKGLKNYLHERADEFDVVDYPHTYLPYPLAKFHKRTLFVARSVLLAHHLETISIPYNKGWRGQLSRFIKGIPRLYENKEVIHKATKTGQEADLINVSNYDDKDELIKRGIPAENIVVLPYGISRERRCLFEAIPSAHLPERQTIVFIGTFDNRKGATDFPEIVQNISSKINNVQFRLLGTFKTKEKILSYFPKNLHHKIEIVPKFDSLELPSLLADVSVGVFPSYLEGFGFAVLEMLAASVPVIAYDAPGPPMMLPPQYLVPRGDTKAMSNKLVELLLDSDRLTKARIWAKQRSQEFNWQKIAYLTSETYKEHWNKKVH